MIMEALKKIEQAYLTIDVLLPGIEGNDLYPDKVVKGKLIPQQVCFYHEGHGGGTCIYLGTGAMFMTSWTIKEYESRVESYYTEVSKRFGKSKSTIFLNGQEAKA